MTRKTLALGVQFIWKNRYLSLRIKLVSYQILNFLLHILKERIKGKNVGLPGVGCRQKSAKICCFLPRAETEDKDAIIPNLKFFARYLKGKSVGLPGVGCKEKSAKIYCFLPRAETIALFLHLLLNPVYLCYF